MTGLRDHLPISKNRIPGEDSRNGASAWTNAEAMTLGDLIDAFLGDFARLVVLGQRRASTLANYRSWAKTWLAEIRHLTVEEISSPRAPARLKSWILDVASRAADRAKAKDGTATATRVLVVLDLVLKRAEFEGHLPRGSSPTRLVRRFAARSRERWLDDAEVARILDAIDRVERARVRRIPEVRRAAYHSITEAIRLLAFTGMRRAEVFRLRWDEVDLEAAVIRLPTSKTTAREVPLSADAVGVLRRQRRRAAGEWCFPSPRGDKPIAYAAHVWRQIVETAGLDPAGLVVHTLRHSLATCALRAGAPLEHVATVLGHRSTAITRRIYSRPLANPGARAVVNDFARSVRAHHQ